MQFTEKMQGRKSNIEGEQKKSTQMVLGLETIS